MNELKPSYLKCQQHCVRASYCSFKCIRVGQMYCLVPVSFWCCDYMSASPTQGTNGFILCAVPYQLKEVKKTTLISHPLHPSRTRNSCVTCNLFVPIHIGEWTWAQSSQHRTWLARLANSKAGALPLATQGPEASALSFEEEMVCAMCVVRAEIQTRRNKEHTLPLFGLFICF